jgi:hypothetical protein
MTLLELLVKWTGLAGPALISLLTAGKQASPDLAPIADDWLAKLNTALDPAALGALVAALPAELADIVRGHFVAKDHPDSAM